MKISLFLFIVMASSINKAAPLVGESVKFIEEYSFQSTRIITAAGNPSCYPGFGSVKQEVQQTIVSYDSTNETFEVRADFKCENKNLNYTTTKFLKSDQMFSFQLFVAVCKINKGSVEPYTLNGATLQSCKYSIKNGTEESLAVDDTFGFVSKKILNSGTFKYYFLRRIL
jgi:hypothetical protein